MMVIDAFLAATITSYFFAGLLPKRVLKSGNVIVEKLGMLLSGSILTVNWLLFHNSVAWVIMGCVWAVMAGLSYLGYAKWNIQYKKEPSDAAQCVMFGWDLLISIVCFMQAGV